MSSVILPLTSDRLTTDFIKQSGLFTNIPYQTQTPNVSQPSQSRPPLPTQTQPFADSPPATIPRRQRHQPADTSSHSAHPDVETRFDSHQIGSDESNRSTLDQTELHIGHISVPSSSSSTSAHLESTQRINTNTHSTVRINHETHPTPLTAAARKSAEDERALYDRYRKMETSLSQSYEAKIDELEQFRKQVLEEHIANQRVIDASNQTKLKQIVSTYKARIEQLEKQLQDSFDDKTRASDQVILVRAESLKRKAEYDSIIDGYKVLVDEQANEIGMLRVANSSITSELSQVKATYEQLISTLGEAQSIKVKQAQQFGAQRAALAEDAEHRLRDLTEAVRRAEAERNAALQTAEALRIDQDRLVASVTIAAESKTLADEKAERLSLENDRLRKEMERLEKLLYGANGPARHAPSNTHSNSQSGSGQPIHKRTITTKRTVTITAESNAKNSNPKKSSPVNQSSSLHLSNSSSHLPSAASSFHRESVASLPDASIGNINFEAALAEGTSASSAIRR